MAIAGRVSRRAALAGGAAALLSARAWAGDAPPAPERIQGAADAAARLTIETHIDGKGPFRFMVDTGADRTIVADDIAVLLGAANAGPVVVQGITSAIPADAVRLRDLSFGSVTIDRLRTPVLPRAALGADGYLGLDALEGRRVEFDFLRNSLSVSRGLSVWQAESRRLDEAAVRVGGQSGRLVSADCWIDGVRASAFVDSGAEITVANSSLFAELKKATGRDYLPGPDIVIVGVTSGAATGRLAAVDRVKLGRLNFSDSTLVVSDLPIFDVWGLARKPAMLIGMNFLKRTAAMTIDYNRQELLFRVAETRVASRA